MLGLLMAIAPRAIQADDAPAPAPAPAPAVAADELIECPVCSGTGSTRCKVKCDAGKVKCPKACLKREDPGWKTGAEVGQDQGQKWKYFPYRKKGIKGGAYWSEAHVGEIIEYQDGMPVTRGLCKTCKGTTKMECGTCKGTGVRVCHLCNGKKQVLGAEAEALKNAEQLKAKDADASEFTLTDGRTIRGKVTMRTAVKVFVTLGDGKLVEIAKDEIAEESGPGKEPVPAPADPEK